MGRLLLILIALSPLLYLLGNDAVSLWDRDEPRYAQASRQMLQSGDWVMPRFLDEPRVVKPVLIYWLQAGSMAVMGDNAFAARFPSALATFAMLIILALWLRTLVDEQRTFWAVFVFGTSALVIAAAKMSITDATLTVFITLSQLCLYSFYRGRASWPIVITFGLSVGLAGLTKGPVVLGVMGMTLVALWLMRTLDRRFGQPAPPPRSPDKLSRGAIVARAAVVILLIALVVTPWLVLMERRIPGYLTSTLWTEIFQRAGGAKEGHRGPPGYYLLTIWGTYFPWCLMLPAAIVMGIWHRSDPLIRFALAAVVGPWLMFEVVQTKLPHYLLPVYPWLALLTADVIHRCANGQYPALSDRPFLVAAGIWALAAIGLGFAPWLMLLGPDRLPITGTVALTTAAVIYGSTVFALFARRRIRRAALAMGLGMAVVVIVAYTLVLPQVESLRLPQRTAQWLIAAGAGAKDTAPGEVVMIEFKEPSLAFYQGGTIREADEGILLEPQTLPPWLVMSAVVWDRLLEPTRRALTEVHRLSGIAYADGGHRETVVIARRADPQPPTLTPQRAQPPGLPTLTPPPATLPSSTPVPETGAAPSPAAALSPAAAPSPAAP